MLKFEFTKGDGVNIPFYAEVDVYHFNETAISLVGVINVKPRLVGNLYCTKSPDGWEVYSAMPGSENDMPVHVLENLEDFPKYVMYEIEEAAWLGPGGKP